MTEKLIERHQDYVVNVPSLPAGEIIDFRFQFDTDAPFELRGLAARMPYDVNGQQNGLQYVAMRYTDNDDNWQADETIPLFCQMAYFGQGGNPLPRYPGLRWPAGGVMRLEVINTLNFGQNPFPGVQLFFRGVKLFQPGQIVQYTYPQKRLRPDEDYKYSLFRPNASLANLGVTDQRLYQTFHAEQGCDYVIRGGQAGLSRLALPAGGPWEVFFTMRDETGKPYSNAPVHADVLFGRGLFPPVYTCGPTPIAVSPVGVGPSMPGLFFPEIYLPKGHILQFDVTRNDAAYAGAAAVNYPVVLHGQKVWPA